MTAYLAVAQPARLNQPEVSARSPGPLPAAR